MPERLAPMLARTGTLPRERRRRWAWEIKWDGMRAIGYVDGGRLRLETRNGNDITPRYPELRALGPELGARDAVLDGEIVTLDGRPAELPAAAAAHARGRERGAPALAVRPVVYMFFDLLWLDGHSLMELPYEERRERLAELALTGPSVADAGARRRRRRGACSRPRAPRGSRASSPSGSTAPTRPGRRSQRLDQGEERRRAELVVGGWLPGKEGRSGRLGALLVGYYDGRRAALRRAASDGLHRGGARAVAGCSRPRARDTPFTAASRRSTRASSSRGWSPRSTTPSGPTPGRCASPRTRGCATTSRRRTSGRRRAPL